MERLVASPEDTSSTQGTGMNDSLVIMEVDGLYICGADGLPTTGFGRTPEQAYDDFVAERRQAIAQANQMRYLAQHPMTKIH
jgi:hypothetical protein